MTADAASDGRAMVRTLITERPDGWHIIRPGRPILTVESPEDALAAVLRGGEPAKIIWEPASMASFLAVSDLRTGNRRGGRGTPPPPA